MEYITETRGGWDEWSDTREDIVGVIINGSEYSRITDVFTDQERNSLDVEFPPTANMDWNISVEQYDPNYSWWKIPSLNNFEEAVDEESLEIDTDKLEELSIEK